MRACSTNAARAKRNCIWQSCRKRLSSPSPGINEARNSSDSQPEQITCSVRPSHDRRRHECCWKDAELVRVTISRDRLKQLMLKDISVMNLCWGCIAAVRKHVLYCELFAIYAFHHIVVAAACVAFDSWKKNAFRCMGERLGWNYYKHKLDPWHQPFFEKS